MTQDYKDTLLRYLTGNLNIETGVNEPQFNETQSKESEINDYINDNVTGSWTVIDIIQGYQSIYSLIYGNTSTNGFLVILDEDMNPIQFIDSYTSGTKFGLFQILRVDEEGKFFGIDINNGTPRFIMLNNIVLKLPSQQDFNVNLRRSYNLPSPLSTASKYFEIIKAVGQARYLIGATIMQSSDPYQLATELVINVGAENEWNNYYDQTSSFEGQCMWASWNQDVLNFKIGGYVAGSSPFYVEYVLDGGTSGKWSMEIPTPSGYEQGNYSINTVILNSSTTYVSIFSSGTTGQQEEVNIYKIDYTEEDVDLVETISGTNLITQSPDNRVKFKIKNGIVFFLYKQYEKYSGVNNTYVYVGIILGMNAYYSYGLSEDGDIDNYYLCIINLFNLYNYYMIGLDYTAGVRSGNDFFIQQLYNPNNYNGIAYENINSLIPNSAVLYDNSNNIAFARNLYNISRYENTTLSVVQIPNTQINDISITPKLLIGETNKILVSNEESFVKNIYETVYLNYYNTLLIQNRNTEDYITNQIASNALNLSISQNTDYDDKKATKFRVNYSDSTNEVFNINPNLTIGEETTVTGNNQLTIQNAKQSNALGYTVDGATEQDGTPTPSNPIDIETIKGDSNGNLKIRITGKNLFNKDDFIASNLWQPQNHSTYAVASTMKSFIFDVSNYSQLTITKTSSQRFGISGSINYPASGVNATILQYAENTGTSKTINVTNYNYIVVTYYHTSDTLTEQEILNSIQIEENSVATNYEPYKENNVLIDLAKENLFDKNNADTIGGFTNGNTGLFTAPTNNQVSIVIPCEANTQYIISGFQRASNLGIFDEYPVAGTSIAPQKFSGATQYTFTTGANSKYIVAVYKAGTETYTYDDVVCYKGDNLTPYYELCKIDDYKDTLSVDSNGNIVINKNIGKVVLNGSETISISNSGTDNWYYKITANNPTADQLGELCSHYINAGVYNANTTQGICLITNGTEIRIRYGTQDTVNNFKTWLSNNNVDLYYPLATPQTITLSNTTLPLFEGINHVTLVEDLETSTSITYDTASKSTYSIIIYNPQSRPIETIDIISNDETITYQTISGLSSLESGKIYNITQDCYVE